MSPLSTNGQHGSGGPPRAAMPAGNLCTCQAKLAGEAGDCHCRVAPQIVRASRRGMPKRLCGDCRTGRHRARGRKQAPVR